MARPNPITVGQTFGRLTVIKEVRVTPRGRLWQCSCVCGGTKCYLTGQLSKGHASSCGCLQREHTVSLKFRHGARRTRTYQAWGNAKSRCYNPKNKHYAQYGGRGISMCDEWKADFAAFLRDMGHCPDRLTLDRIDSDGPYAPGNCRWATQATQVQNSRKAKLTQADVDRIRATFATVGAGVLATELGVHPRTVRQIALHKSWV